MVALAGPIAESILEAHFQPANGKPFLQSSRKIVYGIWKSTGEDLIVFRRADDNFEIHCHGGNAASAAIVNNLESSNVEPINAFDFVTMQASSSESVAGSQIWKTEVLTALTAARTSRAAELLLAQVNLLPQAIESITNQIAAGEFDQALKHIESILQWAEFGIHVTKPRSIVLCGRPNVGKSSLINTIAGFQRAIVHDVPGTTRDVVSQSTAIDGWPVELKDTAGLRESQDRIEAIGIEKAKEQIENAHLKICVFDVSKPWTKDDQATLDSIQPEVVVHNKSDLAHTNSSFSERPDGLLTSTETGDGIEQLIEKLGQSLVPNLPPADQAIPVLDDQVERLTQLLRLI